MKETQELIDKLVDGIVGSSSQECFDLYQHVVKTKDLEGEVVEIGCLYGRTSLAICKGAEEIGKKSVHIDYLFQYPDLETCRLGGYDKYPSPVNIEDAFSKSTHLEFIRNFIKNDLFDNTIIIASKSEQAREIWNLPIKFLFIDADHSYDGVKKDFDLFEPFLVEGGYLALHDVDPQGHPGVVQFYNEIMATGNYQWISSGFGTSLRIIKRIK